MEVDEGPSAVATPTSPRSEAQQYALDSDDETLRFDNDDDLYSSDLDEIDARWVRKQVTQQPLRKPSMLSSSLTAIPSALNYQLLRLTCYLYLANLTVPLCFLRCPFPLPPPGLTCRRDTRILRQPQQRNSVVVCFSARNGTGRNPLETESAVSIVNPGGWRHPGESPVTGQ